MGLNGAMIPHDGSVSVCMMCAGLAMFQQSAFGLTLRMPTEDELSGMLADQGIQTAVAAVRTFHRENPFPPTMQQL